MGYLKFIQFFNIACFDVKVKKSSLIKSCMLLPKRDCVRYFSQTRKYATNGKNSNSTEVKPDIKTSGNFKGMPRLNEHTPNSFEKWLLVYFKKYPSVAEVPGLVPQNVMERVRNLARIRLNILFCFIAAVVCVIMVRSGKEAARRGESVVKQNLDWHKSIEEKSKQK